MPWYVYSIIAGLTVAAVGLLQKKTLQQEHSMEYVTVFSVLKLVLFVLGFGPTLELSVSSTEFFILGLAGLFSGFALLMVTKAVRVAEISTVLPILSLEPGIVAILGLGLLGEKLTGGNALGILLMLVAAYVLELRHAERGSGMKGFRALVEPFRRLASGRGGHFAILGLLAYSIGSILDRYILLRVPVTTYIFYVYVFVAGLNLFLSLSTRQRFEIIHRGHRFLFPLILFIAVLHITSGLAQAKAMSLAAVGLVIAVKRISVLIDVILGGRFFHERNVLQKTLASIIMLIGVYFIVRP